MLHGIRASHCITPARLLHNKPDAVQRERTSTMVAQLLAVLPDALQLRLVHGAAKYPRPRCLAFARRYLPPEWVHIVIAQDGVDLVLLQVHVFGDLTERVESALFRHALYLLPELVPDGLRAKHSLDVQAEHGLYQDISVRQ